METNYGLLGQSVDTINEVLAYYANGRTPNGPELAYTGKYFSINQNIKKEDSIGGIYQTTAPTIISDGKNSFLTIQPVIKNIIDSTKCYTENTLQLSFNYKGKGDEYKTEEVKGAIPENQYLNETDTDNK